MYPQSFFVTALILSELRRWVLSVLTPHSPGAPNSSFRRNICSTGLNRLRYLDLIAVKTRDFFGAKRHFRRHNKENDYFLLFSEGQICRLECKKGQLAFSERH